MKVSIHISHATDEDLAEVKALATALGYDAKSRGGFMGCNYTEIDREMTPADLQQMFGGLSNGVAVAA